MIKRIVGIDPGKSGGIAWFDLNDAGDIHQAAAVKMPDTELRISEQLARLAQKKQVDDEIICYLEGVHAMPATRQINDRQAAANLCKQILGRYDNQIVQQLEAAGVGKRVEIIQGSVGTFTFGQGFGFLRGCLVTLKIRYELVRPVDWQTVNGCRSGGNKNVTKERAAKLFPGIKMTHYIADSLLICNYGHKIFLSDRRQMRR